ncbi:MAG: FAD-dependent oxidoreductase [Burkholderiaceae bacterium]
MKRREFIAAASALPLLGCDKPHLIEGGFTGVNAERGHLLRDTQSWPAPSKTRKTKVIIAGGGVAGLAAARALRLQGINDFVMLELEDRAGGNSKGGMVGGMACPLGAHYLPVPAEQAPQAADLRHLLEELGVRQRVAGRWTYDERYLCHSPQERLFFKGSWQDGLLPVQDVGAGALAQYRQFAKLVEEARKRSNWSIPASNSTLAGVDIGLTAITFIAFLEQQGLTDPQLRWYLDYCCRDDYGAGIATVSAWAGMHYFASRHGFHAPGAEFAEPSDRGSVLTWPEGNGWITHRLALPLGERLLAKRIVTRIEVMKHGVEVDAFDASDPSRPQTERWQAERCIVALPMFVAARVVRHPPALLQTAALQTRYAPWLVANIHIDQALQDRSGAAPSWDNVIYGAAGLGYVDAKHQSLEPVPSATVLTYYRALGDVADGRKQLLERPWSRWRDEILMELSTAHPDLAAKTRRIDITRYGHAMAIPVPSNPSNSEFDAKIRPQPAYLLPGVLSKLNKKEGPPQRLLFAHSDWAAYSVFEEAFAMGHAAGSTLGL